MHCCVKSSAYNVENKRMMTFVAGLFKAADLCFMIRVLIVRCDKAQTKYGEISILLEGYGH